eukprot:1138528-Pelagomonas_calceolata.AAC.5
MPLLCPRSVTTLWPGRCSLTPHPGTCLQAQRWGSRDGEGQQPTGSAKRTEQRAEGAKGTKGQRE